RETDTLGIDAALLAQRLAHPAARTAGSPAEAAAALQEIVQPGDVLLTLGAGDGYQVGEQVLAALQR
ncbi:hypothetical protein SE17_27520, partial [Kouleothrix aurantiaca]